MKRGERLATGGIALFFVVAVAVAVVPFTLFGTHYVFSKPAFHPLGRRLVSLGLGQHLDLCRLARCRVGGCVEGYWEGGLGGFHGDGAGEEGGWGRARARGGGEGVVIGLVVSLGSLARCLRWFHDDYDDTYSLWTLCMLLPRFSSQAWNGRVDLTFSK